MPFTNPEIAAKTGLTVAQTRAIAEVRGVERVGGRHNWTDRQLDELLADLQTRDATRLEVADDE
jgi:hypothetical protein